MISKHIIMTVKKEQRGTFPISGGPSLSLYRGSGRAFSETNLKV